MADELFDVAEDEDMPSLVRGGAWNQLTGAVRSLRGDPKGSRQYRDSASGMFLSYPELEWAFYRLQEPLQRSGSAGAIELVWDGTAFVERDVAEDEVYGDLTRGYHFTEDDVWVVELENRLFVITPGHFQVRGTLDGALTSGGTATLSVTELDGSSNWTDSGLNVTVNEAIGLDADVDAGSVVIADWHEQGQIWIAKATPCPPAASS